MDFRQSKHWQINQSPDVLIVPSKLAQFSREVLGSLVVNPGNLVKGVTGGTYAELVIHPLKEDELRDSILNGKDEVPHAIVNRTKVSIIKI